MQELTGRLPSRATWGAPIVGGAVAVGVGVLLGAFGLAVFFSAGLAWGWAAAWTLVIPIPSALAGGWVAARLAGPVDRCGGAIHGAAAWGVATLVGFAFFATVAGGRLLTQPAIGMSGIAGGGGAGTSGVAASGGNGAGNVVPGILLAQRSMPLLQRINASRVNGQPPIGEASLAAALNRLGPGFWNTSSLNVRVLEVALMNELPLTRAQATTLATGLRNDWMQLRGRGGQANGSAAAGLNGNVGGMGVGTSAGLNPRAAHLGGNGGAATGANGGGAITNGGGQANAGALGGFAFGPRGASWLTAWFWFLFASLLIALFAAISGGAMGVTRDQRASAAVPVRWRRRQPA